MENTFLHWAQAFAAGTQIAGGKGWNLGRLDRYGFKVPPGGVLTAEAYSKFVEFNNLQRNLAEIADAVTIDTIGEKETGHKLARIREMIQQGRVPEQIQAALAAGLVDLGIFDQPVAVRSSAAAEDSSKASFAGIHESFLNVQGIENIMSAIKGCYASLWTERAVGYRRKMGISDQEVLPSVVIMEMAPAEASGIAFTCDPRTGREDVITVNANFGLGESVVAGSVDPDRYCIHNSSFLLKIGSITIGRKEGVTLLREGGGTEFQNTGQTPQKQVLSDENIIRLGYLILRVFAALGNHRLHQDVEWVFDGHDFCLVQARPVTVLPRYTFPEIQDQPDIWSNSNVKDTVPIVSSTLNYSLTWIGNAFLTAFFTRMGYPVPEGLSFLQLFQGRNYLNMAVFQWCFYDSIGTRPDELNKALGGHEPEIKINEKRNLAKTIKRKLSMLKLVRIMSKTKKKAESSFSRVREQTKTMLDKDYRKFSANDFLELFSQLARTAAEYAPVVMIINSSGSFPNLILVKLLEKSCPEKGNALTNALLAGAATITSAEHGYRLVELAEIARNDIAAKKFFTAPEYDPMDWERKLPDPSGFKQGFREFLDEFGHRAIYEMDVINPRWREDPSYPLNIIRGILETADLGKIRASQREKRDQAWAEINRRLPFYRRWLVKYLVKDIEKSVALREMGKSVAILMYEPMRKLAQEFGRRFEKRGILEEQADIYHCTWAECISVISGYWDGKGLDILVGERKITRKELADVSPPDFIIEGTPQFANPVSQLEGNALRGQGVAAGKAAGTARIIGHPNEAEKLQTGDVLVAPSTDPGWTPLFLKVSAIVMETGGFLAHGAIVAREYGVPAVVNIPGAMKIIQDGQNIIVDGDEGKVYLVSRE